MGAYELHKQRAEADELFRRLLFEGYEKLKRRTGGSPYVLIPDLRSYVIGRLSEQGMFIDEAQFDDFLRRQPRVTVEYIILLSPPGRREAGGIWIGKDYFYYVSIYPQKTDEDNSSPHGLQQGKGGDCSSEHL